MSETRFRQSFLLLLVAAITVAFVAMIRAFLLTILLATAEHLDEGNARRKFFHAARAFVGHVA